ncbi:MAG: ABC transporter ATP-binding protein/permease [Nitrospiraceae bacterium]|jgi:subfamily B ATP-binding cassette protein MsbA|uniref:ABC transporter ATP-binding protein n=1 Tax=Nitrospira cf. moscoviensis SBR1015 TaxID=96242 RepID=UPI000A0D0F95|nr:ABC transporter ATP-binding protein [Nitrospira cf. moscoviensis SBR1015]MBY0248911.1 ABC transporter ATP-binding protein/permease [Nitrospiraceae bacterium]OQW34623.1 MAG: ABC transporter ATP-binding protein [Nitrospira sp. SG-bin2]
MLIFKRFLPFVQPYLSRMLLAGLLVMGVAAINLALLRLAGMLWDIITVQHDGTRMTELIGVFLGLVVLQGLCSMGHSYLTAWVSQRIVADFRRYLFRHLQTLDIGFFARRRTGELLSRLMSDVTVIQSVVTETPIDSAKQLVTFVGGIAFLLTMNWRLCLLILIILPVLVLVAKIFGRKLKALSTLLQDHTAALSTLAEEVISGIRIVKSFVQTTREDARFSSQVDRTLELTMRRAGIMALFIPVISLLTFSAAAAVMWYGGRQVIEGTVTPGDLFAFVLFAGILIGPFSSAARVFAQVKEAQGAMQRVFEILDIRPDIHDQPGANVLSAVAGHVRFENVAFAYDARTPVLSHLSFEAKPGEIIAFVGPTGAGKTTVINLLHRFYDPTDGRITVDGHDVRQANVESWYRQLALVPQETILFGGTILDNIRYGNPDTDDAAVREASQAAHAHDFIMNCPDGYETVVGEKGVNLSGGQRQRIAIARAILKNPRILLLDEATSSLDTESERLVQEALERLMKGRTTFVVAHRLSTIQRADRILVLDKGRLVEDGTHDQLMARRGLYHYLYTIRLNEPSA